MVSMPPAYLGSRVASIRSLVGGTLPGMIRPHYFDSHQTAIRRWWRSLERFPRDRIHLGLLSPGSYGHLPLAWMLTVTEAGGISASGLLTRFQNPLMSSLYSVL